MIFLNSIWVIALTCGALLIFKKFFQARDSINKYLTEKSWKLILSLNQGKLARSRTLMFTKHYAPRPYVIKSMEILRCLKNIVSAEKNAFVLIILFKKNKIFLFFSQVGTLPFLLQNNKLDYLIIIMSFIIFYSIWWQVEFLIVYFFLLIETIDLLNKHNQL